MAEPYPAPRATPATVTIPWSEYRALITDAGHWRLLQTSPHTAELCAEYIEWTHRRDQRAISNAISASTNWIRAAGAPTYAELERRRHTDTGPDLTPEQIRRRTDASWAAVEARIGRRRTGAA